MKPVSVQYYHDLIDGSFYKRERWATCTKWALIKPHTNILSLKQFGRHVSASYERYMEDGKIKRVTKDYVELCCSME